MSETHRPAWDIYLNHRQTYSNTHQHPDDPTLTAHREIVPLAHAIADLTAQDRYDTGAYCAQTDPTGQDENYEDSHGERWSGQAVRDALAPVLGALRDVESALDDVDAVRLDLDPDLIDRLHGAAPEVALNDLATDLVDRRRQALAHHGLTPQVLSYLACQHLPVPADRVLYVTPFTPWDYAGAHLGDALSAYASASVQRHADATARIVWRRNQATGELGAEWT